MGGIDAASIPRGRAAVNRSGCSLAPRGASISEAPRASRRRTGSNLMAVEAPLAGVIIAGGRGERLRPMTDTRPKCLVDVAGKPILEWQLASLERAGAEKVAIVGHYLFEAIERYVEQRTGAIRVELVREDSPLGRGGAIRLGHKNLGGAGDVIALNGDVLCDVSLRDVDALRLSSGAAAAILVVPLRSPYGIVETEGTRITGFREKPVLDHWINGGIYALGAEALEAFPEVGDHEDTTFPELAARGRLTALRYHGAWRSIDSPKDLREAEELVAAGALGAAPEPVAANGSAG